MERKGREERKEPEPVRDLPGYVPPVPRDPVEVLDLLERWLR